MKEFLSKMVRGAAILGALAGSANVAKAEKPASSEQQIDIHALAKSTVDQIMKIIDLPADKEAEGRKRIETLVTNTLKKTADLKPAQQAQALRQLVDKAREKFAPNPVESEPTPVRVFDTLDHLKGGLYPHAPAGEDPQMWRHMLDSDTKDLYAGYEQWKNMDAKSAEAIALKKQLDTRRNAFNTTYKVEFVAP